MDHANISRVHDAPALGGVAITLFDRFAPLACFYLIGVDPFPEFDANPLARVVRA